MNGQKLEDTLVCIIDIICLNEVDISKEKGIYSPLFTTSLSFYPCNVGDFVFALLLSIYIVYYCFCYRYLRNGVQQNKR